MLFTKRINPPEFANLFFWFEQSTSRLEFRCRICPIGTFHSSTGAEWLVFVP